MNDLIKLNLTAGNKAVENAYGATLLIFGGTIPCCASQVMKDYELVEGGQSPTTMIEHLSFRDEALQSIGGLNGRVPGKGVRCSLMLEDGDEAIELQLWHGGLMSGAQVWQFMAVDANYHA